MTVTVYTISIKSLFVLLLVFLHLGTLLCMNAAVDRALLQLAQHHVNALKIDLDKMAFELEDDRKVVKKALQDVKADLDQLEKRVSSTEQCVKNCNMSTVL